ncbi:LytR C-terminal domain-containing protein [Streptomyces cellulosae]|uniref:LytR C-terminal domain-containing protein n=1 Tax=Streptomyces cellulosae TaxID=1968 RepID=UPI0004C8A066|nr:LytR C-terminal domain-containing protein [Streptomyces cellulosae]
MRTEGVDDRDQPSPDHTTTLIEYGPGLASQAHTVARAFPGAGIEPVTRSGVSVVLGRSYADSPGAVASPVPAAVPSEVADSARSADDDPCSDLTYGRSRSSRARAARSARA